MLKNYTPGVGCTVDESLLGFQGRCSFKQYIPNKPSKYGIKMYVLVDSKSFYSVCSEIHTGKGTHTPGLPVPTLAVLDLIQPTYIRDKQTTDNYYTSVSLAGELKSNKLTLVGTMKKNKRCIPSSFLDKSRCRYSLVCIWSCQRFHSALYCSKKKQKSSVFVYNASNTMSWWRCRERRNKCILQSWKRRCRQSRSDVCFIHSSKKNKSLANEGFLWDGGQPCNKCISHFHA